MQFIVVVKRERIKSDGANQIKKKVFEVIIFRRKAA
jgi:hypothetical protein